MMNYCGYIKLATLEYPKYMFDILQEHPEIQYSSVEYGEFPHPPTYALVRVAEPPAHNADTQVVDQTTPVQIDGEWYQSWFVRDLTTQEVAFRTLIKEKVELERLKAIEAERIANEQRGGNTLSTTVTYI